MREKLLSSFLSSGEVLKSGLVEHHHTLHVLIIGVGCKHLIGNVE